MTDTTPTPNRLRQLARGKAYPPSTLRDALERAAAHIEFLNAHIYEQDGLAKTIGALVVASGGRVEVPTSVMEGIEAYEIEKSQDAATGAITLTSRKRGGGGQNG